MEETKMNPPRRRRRRTKTEKFKEAYLPYLILFAAAIIIITLVVGSLIRESQPALQVAPYPFLSGEVL